VSQGGSKTFVVNRNNSLITIGRFPILSLSEARGEAKRLLAEFTLGRVRPQSVTYAQATSLFLEDKTRAKRPRTVADYKRLLGRLAFRGQLSDITHADAMRRLNSFKAEGERNHLLVAAKVFFNWCIKRRYITENPFAGLSQKQSPTRSRVLSDTEIQSIWAATDEPTTFNTIVRLLLLTGQRRGEIAALQISWITNDHIVLPKEICKNSREHTFPTGQLASSLLKASDTNSGLLFPARGMPTKPFNGWSKSKATLDKASGVSGWTLHDLRRTFATRLAEQGTPPHVIERLLNHVSGQISGVSAIYNRASYLPEMREALEKWEKYLTALLAQASQARAA
jgi:integrase